MRERKCTLLHQLRWIAHHADTLRSWREKKTLFSLPNVFSRTQPRHSDLTQGRFLPGVLHSYRSKRRTTMPKEPDIMEFIWRSALTQLEAQPSLPDKFSVHTVEQGMGSNASAAKRSSGYWVLLAFQDQTSVSTLHTAPAKIAIISGAWGSISVCENRKKSRLGFDIDTKRNYILNYKTALVSGFQKLFSYPFTKVLETKSSLALFQVLLFISDIEGFQRKYLRFYMHLYYLVWSSFLTILDLLLTWHLFHYCMHSDVKVLINATE